MLLYTLETTEGKVIMTGMGKDICDLLGICRATFWKCKNEGTVVRGKYLIRYASEEEERIIAEQKEAERRRKKNEELRTPEKLVYQDYHEPMKPHIPKPYRSSSARRFTKL